MAADPIRLAIHKALSENVALIALVGTRIYYQQAPQDATYPLVSFHKQSGMPRRFADMSTVEDDLWTIKGIATGSSAATKAEEIAAAVDDLLDDADLTVSGKDTISLLRESDVSYSEVKGADIYRHAGAMYRLRTE